MKELIEKSLLNKIERLEAFEDQVNIKMENISVSLTSNYQPYKYFSIYFEAHPISGTKILETIVFECVLYNNEGSIFLKETRSIHKDNFFGFEVIEFDFFLDDGLDQIGKIRLYPKKR